MKATPVTLEQLNKKIKGLLKDNLDSEWVIAEISELKVNYSGHCYLELVQKNEGSEQLVARCRAVIWANTFRMLQPYFETTTGHDFTEGIKVMVRVVVEFHEVYGLSLNIVDIEPTYTVGELAVRKQKILEKLEAEGVLEMNKELALPYYLNKVAVISSAMAAGYGDFENQLTQNPSGFKFYSRLFPAIMQGNEAEGSIISQLDKIFNYAHLFDAVVIIRGGGASADLECFNSYWLAYNITQFPIPVLSGIGHEQDDTIVDMVAHTRLKTPTAVAEFLIDHQGEVENDLLLTEQQIVSFAKETLLEQKLALSQKAIKLQQTTIQNVNLANILLNKRSVEFTGAVKKNINKQHQNLIRNNSQLRAATLKRLTLNHFSVKESATQLKHVAQQHLYEGKNTLKTFEREVELNDPTHILKKGYSITMKNGKNIKNAAALKKGDVIETLFYKGKKQSEIK
jgi:exodeoxyribonuclease VII large subunit